MPNTHRLRREIESIREGCAYDGEYRQAWQAACDAILDTIPQADDLDLPGLGGSLLGEMLGTTTIGAKLKERLGRL